MDGGRTRYRLKVLQLTLQPETRLKPGRSISPMSWIPKNGAEVVASRNNAAAGFLRQTFSSIAIAAQKRGKAAIRSKADALAKWP
jgi:hypothetical protein